MNTNKRRAKQLGMSWGKANGCLRKLILFHLLKKYGENICFRCKQEIEDIKDLSIEHKKPWLDVSATLFWDINNIAFSHLRCNCQVPKSDSWKKTQSQKMLGDNNPNVKLSDKQVSEIRYRSSLGETSRQIARDYNITHVHVLDIKNNKRRFKK